MKRFLIICVAVLCLVSVCYADSYETPSFTVDDIFTAGDDGYHTYRIPSLIVTETGVVLAFCEGRVNSIKDYDNLHIVLKRSLDNGVTWGALQVVYGKGDDTNSFGNPTVVVDASDSTIWLAFRWVDRVPGTPAEQRMYVTSSSDDGVTWADTTDITTDVTFFNDYIDGWDWFVPGPGRGIQTDSGRLLIPGDCRNMDDGYIHSYTFYSDDNGKTWKMGGIAGANGEELDECQIVELTNGKIMLNARNSYGTNRRAVVISEDEGETWGDVEFSDILIEPGCQGSIIRFTDVLNNNRRGLLFSNPKSETDRVNLTVRLSYDEGKTWPIDRKIHDGPSAYSCLTVLNDSTIACLYEGGVSSFREKIAFAKFNLAWLTENTIGVEEEKPEFYSLSQNYPNPFNPTTEIAFCLSENSYITLSVFNVLGQEVDVLIDEVREQGNHQIRWGGINFPTGIYFYTIRAGDFSKTMKMILLK